MINKLFFCFIFLWLNDSLLATSYSIVFIHIGDSLPPHAKIAFSQARLFNADCPIILLTHKDVIKDLEDLKENITLISSESLVKTQEHLEWMKNVSAEGFWRYTSERFLYLNDLITQYDLKNIFHLEYDNMLYVNLEEILPIFESQYSGIAATFDNDDRCIPGFVYIANSTSMRHLAQCFANHASSNDMQILAIFKNHTNANAIDYLPIMTEEYMNEHELISPHGHKAQNPRQYCQNAKLFRSIFDAAALGQYLGGIDPRNGPSQPGFINESCIFNPSLFTYQWSIDEQGRKIPYAIYGGKAFRINNLHIHSKNLKSFYSKCQ